MSLITLIFCIPDFLRFSGRAAFFHLINVEMNTEILLSLEIIFVFCFFVDEERKAQKENWKQKIMVTRRRSWNIIKKHNNNKFISVLLIVNYVNFFMITLQSYCWLFASRLMIAIWCMRGEYETVRNIIKKPNFYLSLNSWNFVDNKEGEKNKILS